MKNFTRSKEYWDVVENGVCREKGTYTARKLMELKAKNYLFQVIDRNQLLMLDLDMQLLI